MVTTDQAARSAVTDRGRASRDRIVRSAARLMLVQGVSATTVDDVLADARASKSQLYHYFASKRDLVAAVVDHTRSIVMASQQPLLGDIDGWAGLEAWSEHIIDAKTQHGTQLGCPLGTLAAELAATDDSARALLLEAFEHWELRLRDGLAAMRAGGLLRADADIDELSTATMASLQGGLLLAKTARSTRPLRIALDAALAHLRTFAATPTPAG